MARFVPLAAKVGYTTPGRVVACLAVLLLAATAAGCGPASGSSTGAPAASPSVSQRTQAQAHSASASHTSCLVGKWVSTREKDSAPGVFTESGGAGVRMRIAASGSFDIEFAGMTPIAFSSAAGSENAHGSFTFGGRVSGKAKLPSGANVIHWAPVSSSLNYRTLTVTVHLTSPIATTVGPMNIANMTSQLGASSSAIGSRPFSSGTLNCAGNGNTLVSTSPSGMKASGTWTFKRK